MNSRLIMFGLAVVALFLFWAYDEYDKTVNYGPVRAKITSAETLCYLSKGSKRKTTTDERPCPLMRALANSHPEYTDFTVHENAHITYTYDVGGRSYNGKGVINLDGSPAAYNVGDGLEVLVNKTDPTKSRWK